MDQVENVNDESYWNSRFSSGSWSDAGRAQTEVYARANVRQMQIDGDFAGSILDYGCALGDAVPVYAEAFPKANLRGIDISPVAIEQCENKFGGLADFVCGSESDVSFSDVIIASHVMEHISQDRQVVEILLSKCKELFIIVPYKESPLFKEHVNYYEEDYYSCFDPERVSVFTVSYRRRFDWKGAVKNFLMLRSKQRRDVQKEMVLFHLKGDC